MLLLCTTYSVLCTMHSVLCVQYHCSTYLSISMYVCMYVQYSECTMTTPLWVCTYVPMYLCTYVPMYYLITVLRVRTISKSRTLYSSYAYQHALLSPLRSPQQCSLKHSTLIVVLSEAHICQFLHFQAPLRKLQQKKSAILFFSFLQLYVIPVYLYTYIVHSTYST
jgi:hypothetical protein